MYREHVPQICAAMRTDLKVFERAVMFAILSARQPFYTVPDQLADLEKRGAASRHLFSWKSEAYFALQRTSETLWASLLDEKDCRAALLSITQLPGLGVVKGAFILQMMGFDLACIDARNISRENRNPRAYRSDGLKSGKRWEKIVDRYVTDTGGKAEYYWDVWCNEVGPDYSMTGEQCSALHLEVIPKEQRKKFRKGPVCPCVTLATSYDEIPF